ncbi:hypothetical protein LCGC14_3114640 [marine sediment metagenome]|uniref:HTH cro/C1-type domain-containing protein n=1 Tax=marine sediment metagenome TaxID=412755 RepID=A0A0F8W4H2_9ZZZZ
MMNLSRVLQEYRWAKRLGLRELAAEIGVSFPSLSRFELGGSQSGPTLVAILKWLLADAPEVTP